MIIIDQEIEVALCNMLEKMRAEETSARCIYLNLKNGATTGSNFREPLLNSIRTHIFSVDLKVFLCGDGDIFILAPHLPSKGCREFILAIADHLNRAVDEQWISIVELPLHINRLLAEIDAKLAFIHAESEKKKKAREEAIAERKRQQILAGGTKNSANIHERRVGRKTPELMIIEDDAFSRRLVENVLQKKYPLTGLGEASFALDTYARIAPDILFLDINLPDVSGHELLERIIALDPDAYVIMLSGNSDKGNIVQAMSRGAKGFVAKPFTKEKLFQYIERCPTMQHA